MSGSAIGFRQVNKSYQISCLIAGLPDVKDNNGHIKLGGSGIGGFKMNFKTTNKKIPTTIRNVVGTIRGAVEPDRYVILGTHRDAWVYGATDPLAGTGAMMEIMVAISETMRVITYKSNIPCF